MCVCVPRSVNEPKKYMLDFESNLKSTFLILIRSQIQTVCILVFFVFCFCLFVCFLLYVLNSGLYSVQYLVFCVDDLCGLCVCSACVFVCPKAMRMNFRHNLNPLL